VLHYSHNSFVDYQEQTENAEDRWIDRVTTDGNWSGNLFDFTQKVYRKLTADLKIPYGVLDELIFAHSHGIYLASQR